MAPERGRSWGTETNACERTIWEMLDMLASKDPPMPIQENILLGLLMGIRLHSSDSELANLMNKVLISGKFEELVFQTDQFAAMLRKEFMDVGDSP